MDKDQEIKHLQRQLDAAGRNVATLQKWTAKDVAEVKAVGVREYLAAHPAYAPDRITPEVVEAAARAVFESRSFGAPVPWAERGNSDNQVEAREYANAALLAAFAVLGGA